MKGVVVAVLRHVDFEVSNWAEFGGVPVERLGYAERVLSLGPSGYWRLGDAGSSAVDMSGAASGTVIGGVTIGVSGCLESESDSAMGFAGVNQMVDVGRAVLPSDNSAVSIGVWIRTTASTTGAMFSQYVNTGTPGASERFGLRLITGGYPAWWKGGTVRAQGSQSLLDGVWHFVLGERLSTGVIKLWVDGVLVDSGSDSQGFASANSAIAAFPAVSYLTADLDEVMVVPSELGGSMIRDLYDWATGVPKVTGGGL